MNVTSKMAESGQKRHRTGGTAGLDHGILSRAVVDSFRKLDPRTLMKNPVIFVTEVVAALATVLLVRDLATGGALVGFTLQIVGWLWFTVLFANFAEALAEGRGKAQADALRRTRPEVAITLALSMRPIPAMPMAESSAPMVVGMSATSRAISTVIESVVCA